MHILVNNNYKIAFQLKAHHPQCPYLARAVAKGTGAHPRET